MIEKLKILIAFHGDDLLLSGQPWHLIERLQRIIGWFDKWLIGAVKPE